VFIVIVATFFYWAITVQAMRRLSQGTQ